MSKLPHQSKRTHCPRGHLYDEANTIRKKRGEGRTPSRDCRTCSNARMREARRKPPVPVSDPDALLARLDRFRLVTESGCWEWQGARVPGGYGSVRWHSRSFHVHRLIAHVFHGLDLEDRATVARHKCDNPPCFNPDHIEPGTHRDNNLDMFERNRRPLKPTCPQGHPREGNWRQMPNGDWRCRACTISWNQEYRRKSRGHR